MHQSSSPLAKLYQSIMRKDREDDIKAFFLSLSLADKNLIFEMVWAVAGRLPTNDLQWGEHHVFNDMNCFYLAVRKGISTKLDRLSQEQKNQVYHNVYRFAAAYRLVDGNNTDLQWGEHHALENLPRLADAVAL